jgi:hypothetical protein
MTQPLREKIAACLETEALTPSLMDKGPMDKGLRAESALVSSAREWDDTEEDAIHPHDLLTDAERLACDRATD